jgi:antibiotic biosynthesis monooxygenase (ABM) superfamily enzyme
MVKVWVSPEAGERYLSWLDGGYIAKAIQKPGFLWARRYHLEQSNEAGWTGQIIVYGLDSVDSLERYLKSSARKKILREAEAFKDVSKAEKFHGTIDFELTSTGHTLDDEAPVLYCGRFSVAPKSHQQLFEWLDGKHIKEVISQPGFLWARRVHLEGCDEDGWERYIIIYGLASREILEEYFNNPIRERFFRERDPFTKDLRTENFFGTAEFALDK